MPVLLAVTLAGALLQASQPGTLAGRVVEEGTHAPIAGVRVMLLPDRSGPPAAFEPPREVVTGADGVYVFDQVAPGKYRVNIQKAGFALPDLSRTRPQPIEVQSGERTNVRDFFLVRGGAISGRVIDENGQPVTDAFVMPLRRPPVASPRGPALIPSGGGVQTNDLGEFRIHSLAAGEYYLRAAPSPGTRFANLSSTGSQRTTTLLATFFPGTTDPAAAQPVSVAAGQTAGDVVIRILTGSAFRISGIVVDEAGKPVDAAIVMLMPERPAGVPPLPAGPNQVRTDASGAFTVGGVPNGEYVLSAAAPLVLSAGKEGKTAAGFSGGVWSSFEGGSVNGGPAGGMTITETRNGRTVQYRTSRDTEQHLTVGDADVTGVQIIARRPQQP